MVSYIANVNILLYIQYSNDEMFHVKHFVVLQRRFAAYSSTGSPSSTCNFANVPTLTVWVKVAEVLPLK